MSVQQSDQDVIIKVNVSTILGHMPVNVMKDTLEMEPPSVTVRIICLLVHSLVKNLFFWSNRYNESNAFTDFTNISISYAKHF